MDGMFYYVYANERTNVCTVGADLDQKYDPWAIFRGECIPENPIVFRHIIGRQPKDMLISTDAVLRIVSKRFLDILQENKVTGWSTFPVLVYDKKGKVLAGYYGLSVTGRSGPIDDTQQRIEVRESPMNPGYMFRVGIGLHFDQDSWDGSDIFTPQGGMIIVVRKVKEQLECEIKELVYCDIQEYEDDLGPA